MSVTAARRVSPELIVFAGCAVALITFGPRASAGLFQVPMTTEYGWGRDIFGLAIAHLALGEKLLPDIRLQLFDAQRKPVVVRVDIENLRFDAISLFQHAHGCTLQGPRAFGRKPEVRAVILRETGP